MSMTLRLSHLFHPKNLPLAVKHLSSQSFTKTLNLPKTKFPLSMKDGAALKREKNIQKTARFSQLYAWQHSRDTDKEFVLHDGPPYANGDTHVGHALNKIMKDIVNRYHVLRGYKVHYIPGWDCHGVPIEQKALAEIKSDHTQMTPTDIIQKARNFAERTIKNQKCSFESWGVMADWENQCYYTFDKEVICKQLDIFYEMYTKGFIYEDYMPVYWSPSSRTALAEAELEYNEEHESTAVYLKFPVITLSPRIESHLDSPVESIHALIWTTTPWTLPANRAICFADNVRYSILKNTVTNECLIVSSLFTEKLKEIHPQASYRELYSFLGSDLSNSFYKHPLIEEPLPLLPGHHVTSDKGTGLVHTAPAHGLEDFQVAVRNNLDVVCLVNEDGEFVTEAGPDLAGLQVLGAGNSKVLELLEDYVLHKETYVHSYPYDWRSKQPVILRASKQWFVNTQALRDISLKSLQDVTILPKASENGMLSQLDLRTYWCISRQRVWGVPIPVFYHEESGEVLFNRIVLDHIQEVIQKNGLSSWWTLSQDELLPSHILKQCGYDEKDKFTRGTDIMDIWFDSGSTWATVLAGKQADVYLEGLDQFGGWFQSSLLTSAAIRGQAPYRKLVVHGFVVDEEGKKMSKSLGNVINPHVIISGGTNKSKEPSYGIDVLRWWVAQAQLHPKVNIGHGILHTCQEQVFKVRKSLRYLLGNLTDFNPESDILPESNLSPVDRYMLHLVSLYITQAEEAYNSFNFAKVLQLSERFINVHVSGFHCHVTKDRLYCNHPSSAFRRSGQTVQFYILQALTTCIAPILPHLAEEIYSYLPFRKDCDTLFKSPWISLPNVPMDTQFMQTMNLALTIRDVFYKEITTKSPVDFDVGISGSAVFLRKLQLLQCEKESSFSDLNEILQSSKTILYEELPQDICKSSQRLTGVWKTVDLEETFTLLINEAEGEHCKRCRRNISEEEEELCGRCESVLTEGWEADINNEH